MISFAAFACILSYYSRVNNTFVVINMLTATITGKSLHYQHMVNKLLCK